MFAVMFEVQPAPGRLDAYLRHVQSAQPSLVDVDGFVGSTRFRSLTREGWILSLSEWRNERAVVRWRTHAHHHVLQERARREDLADYRLRACEVGEDTSLPEPTVQAEPRGDATEVGDAKALTLIQARRPVEWPGTGNPYDCAEWMGFNPYCGGCTGWDLFARLDDDRDMLLLTGWRDDASAVSFEGILMLKDGVRLRRLRVLRDYAKDDRREAPQFLPAVGSLPREDVQS